MPTAVVALGSTCASCHGAGGKEEALAQIPPCRRSAAFGVSSSGPSC